MTKLAPYILEESADGRSLVVTGAWSAEAAERIRRGEADRLVLNYARGFSERDLEFLDEGWRLRGLDVLDRTITDLSPIERLGHSLEDLSVQAAPRAELDLGKLPMLRTIGAEWGMIGPTLNELGELREVVTWQLGDSDLHAFRDHVELRRLVVKDAPALQTLDGVGDLPALEVLGVVGAPRLHDISDAAGLAATLRELELEDGRSLDAIDDVESLVNLQFMGVSECGDVESFAPLAGLERLEVLYAYGSTRVVDRDLSPLARLPRLREIRMKDRRDYRPNVAELQAALDRAQ